MAIVQCTIQKEGEKEQREDKGKLCVYCQYTHKLKRADKIPYLSFMTPSKANVHKIIF